MKHKPVNFYPHTPYWRSIESSIARYRCVIVKDDRPDEILNLVDGTFNAEPAGVVLRPASAAAIPDYIFGAVEYAVFKDFGDGVLNLIGWFDRKPSYWPGRCDQS